MSANPVVSVIIPVFNGERYIQEAIESVMAQQVPSLELIVVDDGSTDSSAAVVERVMPEARCLCQSHAGPGAARNLGTSVAIGRFLAFLDADDTWQPDKLSRQLAAFDADPALDIVTGLVEQFRSPELEPAVALRLHCPDQPLPGYVFGAALIRREAFDRVGPIATNVTRAEGVDWFARARGLGLRIHELPEVVLNRRLHTTNSSLRNRDSAVDFVRVLKASLDRRRGAAAVFPEHTSEAG